MPLPIHGGPTTNSFPDRFVEHRHQSSSNTRPIVLMEPEDTLPTDEEVLGEYNNDVLMEETMGDRIARLMKAKNLSQKEFAQAIESTEASVSRYLSNAREPGAKVLVKIANVLGVTVDEIVGKEDESDFSAEFPRIKLLLARNSKIITNEQKKEIINALLTDSTEDSGETF